MSTTTQTAPAISCARVTVTDAQDLSPTFRRIRVAGPELQSFSPRLIGHGEPTVCRDAYIKLVIPPPGSRPIRPDISNGFRAWFARPVSERGQLRTYTARSIRWIELAGMTVPEMTVDFVLHAEDQGPGGQWASAAEVGDTAYVLGPGDDDPAWATWGPGSARRIVAVGDETAVPALLSIIEELSEAQHPVEADVILEVPLCEDFPRIQTPSGIRVHALARSHTGAHGTGSVRELAHVLELPTFCVADVLAGRRPDRAPVDTARVWEVADPDAERETYVFLAGEAASVKAWRRLCVDAAGIPKENVTFMGYWRRGHAES